MFQMIGLYDVDSRIVTHNNGYGAKYTRTRLPVKLIYQEGGYNRSTASKREYEIKHYSRSEKLALIENRLR
jgi:putative endonuclease